MDLASQPDFLPPVLLLQSTLETAASDHAKIRIWRKVCNAPHVSSVYRINKCIPSLSLVWPWFLLQGHFSLIPILDLTLNPCWVTRKPLNLPFSFMSQAFAFKDFFCLEFSFYQHWAHSRIIKPLTFLCSLYWQAFPLSPYFSLESDYVHLLVNLPRMSPLRSRTMFRTQFPRSVCHMFGWLEHILKAYSVIWIRCI